jgi:signal peptide peptidase SppA
MNSTEVGDKILTKIPFSKLEKTADKLSNFLFKFVYWCEDTLLGGITLSTLKIIWGAFIVFIILITVPSLLSKIDGSSSGKEDIASEVASMNRNTDSKDENCPVIGIDLHGGVVTYVPYHAEGDTSFNYDIASSDYIVKTIKEANEDKKVKAIVIEVDSGGGSPVAGEEIANAVKGSEKPVVAYIRDSGASAAYWAISSASKIFASKNSNVGSIGVTGSYLNKSERNRRDGYVYEQLSVGKYKDSGSSDKPLTEEERALFMRDVNIVYANFIQAIANNRKLSVDKVKSIADGSTVLGQRAKELGLIDEIGGLSDVEKYLEPITKEKTVICWR